MYFDVNYSTPSRSSNFRQIAHWLSFHDICCCDSFLDQLSWFIHSFGIGARTYRIHHHPMISIYRHLQLLIWLSSFILSDCSTAASSQRTIECWYTHKSSVSFPRRWQLYKPHWCVATSGCAVGQGASSDTVRSCALSRYICFSEKYVVLTLEKVWLGQVLFRSNSSV